MRSGSSLPAALAVLIAAAAHAQGSTATTTGTAGTTTTATTTAGSKDEGGSCFSCGPTFGTTVVDIGWNTSPSQLGVLPGIRLGYRLEKGFVAGDLGLSLWTSPSIGYGQFALKLGGVYAYDFGKAGPLDIYGLGGLDVNLLATISSGGGYIGPLYGFTLGAGLEYALDKRWTLGAEVGLHTLLDFGP
ncbi:MAG TPA: outer membrane beta-barrel protein, partial [Myxococcales bacterium]|nr:outer membrane beta-barrel protein [Myxococcales bacterium]